MITSLDIRNYALIDELSVDFAAGLTIITGETGAGKSIILGGLGLIMGQRADTKALFDSTRKCIVEANFDIRSYGLKSFFQTHELDYDEELVIRREISPSGKTRAFVNDTPVRLSLLQELSRALLDLHQQFDTLDIHNVSFQLRMLDALADNKALLAEYSAKYKQHSATVNALRLAKTEQERLRQEADFITFQLQEFAAVSPQVEEDIRLEQELKLLENAEDVKRVLGAAGNTLTEHEQAIVYRLKELLPGLNSLEGVSGELDELLARLHSAAIELEDIGESFLQLAEATEFDEARIAEVQERLSVLYKMFQKHNVQDITDLLTTEQDYKKREQATSEVDQQVEQLTLTQESERQELVALAKVLRARRQSVVAAFLDRIHRQLAKLSMTNARLEIHFEELDAPGSTGMDRVEYMFSANKGGQMLPIKGVASGGELSRLTLVAKSLVAASIPLPTLIFDEIDAGVSGDVALRMGDILQDLSRDHQVVTITHSPQVASKADRHYFVYKEDLGDRTATRVKELDERGRKHALAVMLSSDPPSKAALANAEELLSSANS